ncbi:MAG: hypothetical protein AMXMBFR66_38070 [Pseudomonadota bacterium]|nr:hypothetical protein [Rubrivivax sp.]
MPRRDDLAAPATLIVADRDAYLGQGRHDIGRRVAGDQVELVVAGDAAAALQREFEQHAAEFIALHDVGTDASLRLLSALAVGAGARVQRLMVRRQGHGVALAVLQFVETRRADGTAVRLYATDISADGATRAALARVLLGWSRLGVLLLGDLSGHALGAALTPLREAITRGPWPNRELLVVPLGASSAAAAQTSALAAGTPLQVHITPQAGKPSQVWDFVSGTWNRQHGPLASGHALETDIARALPAPSVPWSEATTEPMPLGAGGTPPARSALGAAPRAMPVPGATRWQSYVERCAALEGALAVCVFDLHSKEPLAACGGPPAAARLAEQGSTLLAGAADALRALGLAGGREELAVSAPDHHLLLRPVPGHPGVALLLVLAATPGNPMLARLQLERTEPPG